MSTHQLRRAIAIYVDCKHRWFDKCTGELIEELENYKYCEPKFRVDIWQKSYAYYRMQIFKNKSSSHYFNFCS